MFFLARSEENVAAIRRIPIVFVPGIMGTRLRIGERNWDPDDEAGMLRWANLTSAKMRKALVPTNHASLLTEGTSCSSAERKRGWASLAQKYYHAILRMLDTEFEDHPAAQCPVYAFGYDWRRSNGESGTELSTFVRAMLVDEDADEVIFVTHSMGGLVVRAALKADRELCDKRTRGVVHIAQPVRGAPVAYRRMLYGTTIDFDGWAMRLLLGRAPLDTFHVFSALPGALELLPSDTRSVGASNATAAHQDWLKTYKLEDDSAENGTFPKTASVYNLYRWKDYHPPAIAPHIRAPHLRLGDTEEEKETFAQSRTDAVDSLDEVRKFHRNLGTFKHPLTWSIVGSGIETDAKVVIGVSSAEGIAGYRFDATDVERGRSLKGDGTVPLWSALALDKDNRKDDDGDVRGWPANAGVDAELHTQFELEGVVHDTICALVPTQLAVSSIVAAMLEEPAELLRTGITCSGFEILVRYLLAKSNPSTPEMQRAAKAAEIELRAAKWYREARHTVQVLSNPGDSETPDLLVDGETVEVKYSKNGGKVRVKELMQTALSQKPYKILLVRGTDAVLTTAEFREIAEQEIAASSLGTPELELIEERQLPPLR